MSNPKKDPASEVPSAGEKGVLPPPEPASLDVASISRLLSQVLYTIRYKTARGVETKLVAGSTPAKARKVAETYVNREPGRFLLNIVPAVAADETILGSGVEDKSNPTTSELSRQ